MVNLIVGSGQSGAMGYPGMEGGDKTINPHVFALTDDGWVIADPSKPPFNSKGDDFNSVYWNACKDVQVSTGVDTYLVLEGKGGTPISEWGPGKPQWLNLDAAVTAALATPELAGKTEADYFYWYHGGADPLNKHYAADFLSLRDRAIASGWLTEDTVTVVGETLANGESKEALLNMIGSGDYPWMRFASNDGLVYGNGPHITGESCVVYGHTFFAVSQTESADLPDRLAYDHFDFGTKGNDILYGIDNTLVLAAGGDDRIEASGAGSLLVGGPGDDVFALTDFGAMTVSGGRGWDTLHVWVEGEYDADLLTLLGIERVKVHYE